MRDDIMLGDTPKAKKRRHRVASAQTRGRLWKHSMLADIDGLLPSGQLETLFAFTLVRNPWDRMVSYYHWLQTQSFDHVSVRLAQSLDFNTFACHPNTAGAFRTAHAARYMQRADRVEQCQAYIRIEHFAEDAQPLIRHLGFDLNLSRENQSRRNSDHRSYFNDAAVDSVAQSCAMDIARFGYKFE